MSSWSISYNIVERLTGSLFLMLALCVNNFNIFLFCFNDVNNFCLGTISCENLSTLVNTSLIISISFCDNKFTELLIFLFLFLFLLILTSSNLLKYLSSLLIFPLKVKQASKNELKFSSSI